MWAPAFGIVPPSLLGLRGLSGDLNIPLWINATLPRKVWRASYYPERNAVQQQSRRLFPQSFYHSDSGFPSGRLTCVLLADGLKHILNTAGISFNWFNILKTFILHTRFSNRFWSVKLVLFCYLNNSWNFRIHSFMLEYWIRCAISFKLNPRIVSVLSFSWGCWPLIVNGL